MSQLVLFMGDSPLLLENVQRDEGGRVLSGDVVNGAWHLRLSSGRYGAYTSANAKTPVNKFSTSPEEVVEVAVPAAVKGDYNSVIDWAMEHRAK